MCVGRRRGTLHLTSYTDLPPPTPIALPPHLPPSSTAHGKNKEDAEAIIHQMATTVLEQASSESTIHVDPVGGGGDAPLAVIELTVLDSVTKFKRRGGFGRNANGDDVWFDDDPGSEDNASNSDWVGGTLNQHWNFDVAHSQAALTMGYDNTVGYTLPAGLVEKSGEPSSLPEFKDKNGAPWMGICARCTTVVLSGPPGDELRYCCSAHSNLPCTFLARSIPAPGKYTVVLFPASAASKRWWPKL